MLREDVAILVVDDVQAMRTQIREMLKESGFKKVRVAANGEEGKIALSSEPTQLVLADWKMEPLDGMGLLKFVRSHPTLKDMAFIMITAETTKERVVEAIQSGVDDYIVKPLTIAQIQSKVYGVLIKKQVLL
jgi:two-component system chemotaxis response regulator CheY